jgi:glutathione S-transferase
MRLIQIPFSHNCIKVRRVLELKGLAFETQDIVPVDRAPVRRASGQSLVPVLIDGERTVSDSTAILLYLENAYPDPPLLPAEAELRADCLLLEDWADSALMALTRRLAYWNLSASRAALAELFFPDASGLRRRWKGRLAARLLRRRLGLSEARNRRDEPEARRLAGLAVGRLSRGDHLVGERLSLADVTLAAMSAPLWSTAPAVRDDPAVQVLLGWGRRILGEDSISCYRPRRAGSRDAA